MEHPDPKYRKIQEERLSRLSGDERSQTARFYRIGNAVFAYHEQAGRAPENRLIEFYKEWLQSLPAALSHKMAGAGFNACKSMLPFTRYVEERMDCGLTEWMKEHLSQADFAHWRSLEEADEDD